MTSVKAAAYSTQNCRCGKWFVTKYKQDVCDMFEFSKTQKELDACDTRSRPTLLLVILGLGRFIKKKSIFTSCFACTEWSDGDGHSHWQRKVSRDAQIRASASRLVDTKMRRGEVYIKRFSVPIFSFGPYKPQPRNFCRFHS